jgi:hypothetical protein
MDGRLAGVVAVNRRTLDVALPMLYAAIIVVTVLISSSSAVITGVAVVGAVLLGIYYAAVRRNLS